MDVAFLLDKYFKDGKNVSIDVFDAHTLNAVYKDVIAAMTAHLEIEVSVLQALRLCLEDKITDGKGLGFGLYTTSRLVDSIGKKFVLHSGKHKLEREDGVESVMENGFWQGTLIFMVIGTGEEIDPNRIVDHRTDVVEEYNETFVESSEIESLW